MAKQSAIEQDGDHPGYTESVFPARKLQPYGVF